jgi:hypothetical protein
MLGMRERERERRREGEGEERREEESHHLDTAWTLHEYHINGEKKDQRRSLLSPQ